VKRLFLFLLVVSLQVPDAYGVCTPTCSGSSLDVKANCCAICDGNPHPEMPYPSPCTQATDDTCSINQALDAVGSTVTGAGGGEVIIPPGTCIISPGVETSSDPNRFLHLYSNLTIRGSGPKSVLMVKNGANDYMAIFEANGCPTNCPTLLSNVTIRDFRIDQNPAQNPATIKDLGSHLAIFPGETLPNPNAAGRFTFVPSTGLTVSGMVFDQTDSANTILLNNVDPLIPLRTTITNNYFHFVRNHPNVQQPPPPYDVSTVYAEGSQQVITGNTFITSLPDQPVCAIETLSGRNVIANNTIQNYVVGMDILPSYATCPQPLPPNYDPVPDCPSSLDLDPNETVIANNSITCAQGGMVIFPTTGLTLHNVSITGNSIDVCNATRSQLSPPLATGLNYAGIKTIFFAHGMADHRGYEGNVDGLIISNNVITMQKENRDYLYENNRFTGGILLHQIGNLANVLIKGNIVKDAPVSGIRLGSAAVHSTVQTVRIVDNIIVDAGNNNVPPNSDPNGVYRHSIGLFDVASNVDIAGNLIYDTATRGVSSNQLWGLNALYLQPAASSANVRTGKNIVRVSPTSTGQLLSPQDSTGQLDTTGVGDVQVTQFQGASSASPPLFPVDFTSFTRYVVTITPPTGTPSLPVTIKVAAPSPVPDVANSKQFTHGQLVAFRFLCSSQVPAALGCVVQFDGLYATAGDLGGGGTPIARGNGRSITFQVEVPSSGSATHYFFELYRTSDVPNP